MNPFTFQYRGLTFGEGTDVIVEDEVAGLRTLEVESGSRPAPQFNGSIPGVHLVRGMDIFFPLRVLDPSLLSVLNAVFQPHPTTEFPMEIRLESAEEWLIYARPVARREVVAPQSYKSGAVPYRVVLERTNPHWYGTFERSLSIPIYSIEGGGFDLPNDLPFDLGDATELTAVAHNAGNWFAYPVLRVQRAADSIGTFAGFSLINETAGTELAMSLSIEPGQTLVVDFFAYAHALRGQDPIRIDDASRFSSWVHPRVPLALAPGDNVLRLELTGTDIEDTMALLTWRDTNL